MRIIDAGKTTNNNQEKETLMKTVDKLGGIEKWCIIDENNQFVHEDSIRKIRKNEYTYTSYQRPERSYPTEERVNQAIEHLTLHNIIGKLGHTFNIIIL